MNRALLDYSWIKVIRKMPRNQSNCSLSTGRWSKTPPLPPRLIKRQPPQSARSPTMPSRPSYQSPRGASGSPNRTNKQRKKQLANKIKRISPATTLKLKTQRLPRAKVQIKQDLKASEMQGQEYKIKWPLTRTLDNSAKAWRAT